jgi:hypothetical protein
MHFCAFFFALLTLVSCAKQAQGNRNVIIYSNEGTVGDIILENEFLEFRFFPKTTEIVLSDKSTGAQWRSNPPGYQDDPLSDLVTRVTMGSQFTLDYADVSGVGMTLYSNSHSVEHGAYHYALVDGGLEVSYTVGDLAKNYMIPPVAAEDRMLLFLDKMDAGNRSMVLSSYRLYDINNLRANDNRAELLNKYPDLAEKRVYVLRDDSPEYIKAENEEFFAAAGYTLEDYAEDSARYPAVIASNKPAFNVTLLYALEGKSLVVSVPFDRIAYQSAYPITQLSIMPYLGAGGLNDEGYILVPDGSGALIYFNNGKQNQLTYNNYVYGWDEGLPRTALISENRAPFPVFGIQKNGNALLCVIDEGASYASVRANVSGRSCSWNNVFARFDMIHGAQMDITSRTVIDVYNYENSLPENEKIVMKFTPCASGGYVGMAKEYRSWLMGKYPALSGVKDSGVPIAVEILGAVNKTQHRFGIPFDLPLKLSSYREARAMVNDFASFGWKNVQVKLMGWFNRSVDHSVPSTVKLIPQLGSRRDFSNLTSAVRNNGYSLYPDVDFFYMKDTRPFDGFSLYRDAARYGNRKRIEKYPFSFVWFGERNRWGKLSYIASPVYMMALIDNFNKTAAKYGLGGISFRNIASRLTGDYNEKQRISREASMELRREKLDDLRRRGIGIMVNTGYAYAAPYAAFITDMAIDDQAFGITDASVPFYPMVLHGLVPYTGRAINLAEDYTKNLLKTIESGAGLYFSFMTEETSILQETKFRQFYANEYHKWVRDADTLYRRFSADFGGLYGQAITDHSIISNGLTLTAYEDGTRVVVNINDIAALYGGMAIGANSYVVLRRGD